MYNMYVNWYLNDASRWLRQQFLVNIYCVDFYCQNNSNSNASRRKKKNEKRKKELYLIDLANFCAHSFKNKNTFTKLLCLLIATLLRCVFFCYFVLLILVRLPIFCTLHWISTAFQRLIRLLFSVRKWR